jgi:hypothetical protein
MQRLFNKPLGQFWQLQELQENVHQHQRSLTMLHKLVMQKELKQVVVVAVVLARKCKLLHQDVE